MNLETILTKWENLPIDYQYGIMVVVAIYAMCFPVIVKYSILEMGTDKKFSGPISILFSFILLSILVPIGLVLVSILQILTFSWGVDNKC